MGFLMSLLARPRMLIGGLVVLALVSAWLMFQHVVAERNRFQSELENARQEIITLEQRVQLAQRAAVEREVTRVVERRVVVAVEAAEEDIANAQDIDEFYTAWTAGVVSVRNAGANGATNPDPVGANGGVPSAGYALQGEPSISAIASAPVLWGEGRAAGGLDYQDLQAA